MTGGLWVQDRMEKQEYMEMLQQIKVDVECQMVVKILFEMIVVYLLVVEEDAQVGEVMNLFGLANGNGQKFS